MQETYRPRRIVNKMLQKNQNGILQDCSNDVASSPEQASGPGIGLADVEHPKRFLRANLL